ncbi:MAG: cupin protein [Solirubrobacterales bacterium]|jgi:mannose-6-phosphate isomerase-like protein (cupin superfamily)|nr:cupin protein [Solirubrobacterales bacterium]
MSDYTHKNITEVDDSAPGFGFGEMGEVRFAKDAFDAEKTGFTHIKLNPDQRMPFAHKHDQAEEVYVVIAGSGRVKLGDEIVDVVELDAIRVSPAVERGFEAGPEGISLLAFGPRHDGDGEVLQDWWTD